MKQLGSVILLTTTLATGLPSARAQNSEVMVIEGTRIRGDQEMPTVMYLMPWQSPEVEELRARDEQLMIEPEFVSLERYEFQRLVRYHEAFKDELSGKNATK